MNEQHLERVIDAAARQIVGHAPSESLTDTVMTRVRNLSGDSPPRAMKGYGPFLVRWATISLCATACVVMVLFFLNKSPESISQSSIRSSSIRLTAEHASEPVQLDAAADEKLMPPSVARITRTASQPPMTQAGLDPIEPIVFETIAPQPIDLAAIAIDAPLIDRLVVEPIVIEPLSASND
jgi:hypothetical protein